MGENPRMEREDGSKKSCRFLPSSFLLSQDEEGKKTYKKLQLTSWVGGCGALLQHKAVEIEVRMSQH